MNPALPLLALATAAGLALRPRSLRLPWLVLGAVGVALLAPALSLPDGVPSPGGELAHYPPWQDVEPQGRQNPHLRDVIFQIQPWLIFQRRELRQGRLPLWNPHQFSGAPFWSNGQSAVLFPLHLLFALLPLQWGLVLLPWLRFMVAGCGTWVLARELGSSSAAALVSAVIFALSGMFVSFFLFPIANALALVPWVFVAVERLAAGRGTWRGVALAMALQLLAGHPETAVLTGILAALYLLVRGSRQGLRTWGDLALGWLVAAAVAAIQLLPTAFTVLGSGKWLDWTAPTPLPLDRIGALLLRLVVPDLFGDPAEGSWWGQFTYIATAIYVGALALPLALAGAVTQRRHRRWLAVAVLTLFSLAAAYQLPGVRELLLAVPVVKKALHHYLKIGLELGLALLAGAGLDAWLAGRRRVVIVGSVLTILLAVTTWALFAEAWRLRGLLGRETLQVAWVGGLALLLALSSILAEAHRRRLAWAVVALLGVDLLWAHGRINPGHPAAELYPVTGSVEFLRHRSGRVAGLDGALRPNAAMVYGLRDIRGDDPVKLAHYEAVYGGFATPSPVYFRPLRDWRSPWLDRLGVRWVVAGAGEEAPVGSWRLAYAGEDARVFQRPGALPLVRWHEGSGELEVERREPGRWQIRWQADQGGFLVVAETWDRGWRARIDDRPAPVEAVEGLLLGVRLPPGSGRLVLSYRPQGFGPGALASVLGLGVLLAPLQRLDAQRFVKRWVDRAGKSSQLNG